MAQESWKREQEETACQTPEGPVLCVNNCGFFGSSTTMGMCSKCYRDHLSKQVKTVPGKVGEKTVALNLPGTGMASAAEPQNFQGDGDVMMVDEGIPASTNLQEKESLKSSREGKQQPNRCFICKKRVGLTGFKCRCDRVFCSSHRHSDQHNCSFDYKAAGRDAIAKANPVVKAGKVEKI